MILKQIYAFFFNTIKGVLLNQQLRQSYEDLGRMIAPEFGNKQARITKNFISPMKLLIKRIQEIEVQIREVELLMVENRPFYKRREKTNADS